LSGFLSRALGTCALFAVSAAGFTFASFMCGITSSIDDMIVWRAVQGFIGGGMIPTVFAAAFTVFPPSRQTMVTPLIGLIATLAPTVGPTVGGYLTEALSWHWLFFINVIPGIAVTAAALVLIDFDKPDYSLLDHFDWWGLIGMAGFLGALEYVLEEGPRNDWLQDDAITYAAIFSTLSAVAFFYRAFTARVPIVDLRAFGNRNFAIGSMFSFVLGIGLYGLTYLYPVYLAQVRGYNSLMIGETMFVSGLTMFVSAPIVGRLVAKIDPRFVLMGGFLLFAVGTFEMQYVTKDWDFWELFWPQIFRGFGLMCAMVPVTNASLGTLPPDRVKNASGLFNLTRNLGGAIGLAAINTIVNDRMDLHLARLHDAVNWSRGPATDMLANLTAHFHDFGSNAPAMALKQMSVMARREATVMSFSDIFLLLTILFVALAALAIVMKRPAVPAGAAAGAH
jgi:MFS transporter, DHA2 family, multidrug resistance protein